MEADVISSLALGALGLFDSLVYGVLCVCHRPFGRRYRVSGHPERSPFVRNILAANGWLTAVHAIPPNTRVTIREVEFILTKLPPPTTPHPFLFEISVTRRAASRPWRYRGRDGGCDACY